MDISNQHLFRIFIPNSFSCLSMQDFCSLSKTNRIINSLAVTALSTFENNKFSSFMDFILNKLSSTASYQMLNDLKSGFRLESIAAIQTYVLRKLVYLSMLVQRLEDKEIEAINLLLSNPLDRGQHFFARSLQGLVTKKQFEKELAQVKKIEEYEGLFLKTLSVGQFSFAQQIVSCAVSKFNLSKTHAIINHQRVEVAMMHQEKYVMLNTMFFSKSERKVVVKDLFSELIESWLNTDPSAPYSQVILQKIIIYSEFANSAFMSTLQMATQQLYDIAL